MKRFISMLLIGATFLFAGCNGEEEKKALDITGTWELTGIEITKAAQLGDETIEVVITFNAENSAAHGLLQRQLLQESMQTARLGAAHIR